MDHDEDRSLSLGTEVSASVPPPSPLTGCYLLAVIGEPHTHEHKEIILQRLVKGLLSWDSGEHQVDLEKELATLTAQAPEGEEARYGERLIQYASENLVTEILIHPQMNTLMQCMRNLLSSFTRHRHLVHAGYTFAGNGSWIMQDGTFSLADFTDAYQENEVQRVIRAYENSISIDIHCSGGDWHKLPDMPFVKHCKIRINPTDILDTGSQAIKDFVTYLEPFIVPASLEQLLISSDVVGNIRFSHPTLYVFPGGQGDAALFGINGFNMLVDGGFSRKACWWDFARHLDRLDAVLFTRINNCSVSGMASVLHRKATASVYPQIGHFFCNLEERRALASPDGDKDADPLLVSLLQTGSDMMTDLRHINLKPQHCYRSPEPINLYHKVGHGTLDMYVLNPSKDSKYVREFLKKWHNSEQKLFESAKISGQFNFPIPNLVSICALLVWRPANPDDTITRIMFPGSTPQHKIFEGLEKLKHLEFLQYPTYTGRQMTATAPLPATTTTVPKPTKTVLSKGQKEKSIITEKKEDKIMESDTSHKFIKDETDSKNIIDNKLLNELVDGEEKKIESVLNEAITARVDTKIDDKINQFENNVIDSMSKKKEAKKKIIDKKIKRTEKSDDGKDTAFKQSEVKRSESDKIKFDYKKKHERTKPDITASVPKSKVSQRILQKTVEKKSIPEKKSLADEKKSPPTTPKKISDTRATTMVKDKIKGKIRKLSPGSTPAKSTKEANNRRVAESKYKQASPKREPTTKVPDKKEPKPKREPISRRPRPLGSPIKGLKAAKSPTKTLKSVKSESSKIKGLQRVNYEDILKDAKKSDEDTSLDDIKQQELDDREEQEIVREIEAVFNRDSEAEEKIEYVGRSDIEKITCILDDTKTETTVDGEFEEEYLIIEKEEVDQYTEESIADRESSHEKEDELQKHKKDKEESEKDKVGSINLSLKDKKIEELMKPKIISEKETKELESKEHSVSLEEKQDISSEKKTDSKSGITKPKDSMDNIVHESHPDEKVSTTIESGATTAPTLPEDERITLDEIKEQVEEKYIKEETKEVFPPQTLVDFHQPFEKSKKVVTQPVAIRDIVKTPDEVADLPLHEEVDYRTYEEKKTPIDEEYKRKSDLLIDHEIPRDLALRDKHTIEISKDKKAILDDVIIKTVQRPSHAELVTVTPGSAPESPIYQDKINKTILAGKEELAPVKEYDVQEYPYSQYTEKLRETHITTVHSPIKDEILVIEEISTMPEKIPSIPEDVEKEIEEASKLEKIEKPILSPKDVEKIVADVAEVLKSDKSLDELIAEKSPMLRKSPELFSTLHIASESIEATKKFIFTERDHTDIGKHKKEGSPLRSTTSEDVSDATDKTILSDGKRIKREITDSKDILIQKDIDEKFTTEVNGIHTKLTAYEQDVSTDSLDQIDILEPMKSLPKDDIESERRLSGTLETAKTLERLEEKITDLKKKGELSLSDKSQQMLSETDIRTTQQKQTEDEPSTTQSSVETHDAKKVTTIETAATEVDASLSQVLEKEFVAEERKVEDKIKIVEQKDRDKKQVTTDTGKLKEKSSPDLIKSIKDVAVPISDKLDEKQVGLEKHKKSPKADEKSRKIEEDDQKISKIDEKKKESKSMISSFMNKFDEKISKAKGLFTKKSEKSVEQDDGDKQTENKIKSDILPAAKPSTKLEDKIEDSSIPRGFEIYENYMQELLAFDEDFQSILKNYTIFSEPEENVIVKTEKIILKQIAVTRTTVTKTVKTKYADIYGHFRKVQTLTIISVTDVYLDGTSTTTLDGNTTFADIEDEDSILKEFDTKEDTSIVERNEEKYTKYEINTIIQKINTITIKEVYLNPRDNTRKLKKTVKTKTEIILSNNEIENIKTMKIFLYDYNKASNKELNEKVITIFITSTKTINLNTTLINIKQIRTQLKSEILRDVRAMKGDIKSDQTLTSIKSHELLEKDHKDEKYSEIGREKEKLESIESHKKSKQITEKDKPLGPKDQTEEVPVTPALAKAPSPTKDVVTQEKEGEKPAQPEPTRVDKVEPEPEKPSSPKDKAKQLPETTVTEKEPSPIAEIKEIKKETLVSEKTPSPIEKLEPDALKPLSPKDEKEISEKKPITDKVPSPTEDLKDKVEEVTPEEKVKTPTEKETVEKEKPSSPKEQQKDVPVKPSLDKAPSPTKDVVTQEKEGEKPAQPEPTPVDKVEPEPEKPSSPKDKAKELPETTVTEKEPSPIAEIKEIKKETLVSEKTPSPIEKLEPDALKPLSPKDEKEISEKKPITDKVPSPTEDLKDKVEEVTPEEKVKSPTEKETVEKEKPASPKEQEKEVPVKPSMDKAPSPTKDVVTQEKEGEKPAQPEPTPVDKVEPEPEKPSSPKDKAKDLPEKTVTEKEPSPIMEIKEIKKETLVSEKTPSPIEKLEPDALKPLSPKDEKEISEKKPITDKVPSPTEDLKDKVEEVTPEEKVKTPTEKETVEKEKPSSPKEQEKEVPVKPSLDKAPSPTKDVTKEKEGEKPAQPEPTPFDKYIPESITALSQKDNEKPSLTPVLSSTSTQVDDYEKKLLKLDEETLSDDTDKSSLLKVEVEGDEFNIQEFTIIEDTSVTEEKEEKTLTVDGKNIVQILHITTVKEILGNKKNSLKKLRTTITTVTESILPDGITEKTTDVKVIVSDYGEIDDAEANFVEVGQPSELVTTTKETKSVKGVKIEQTITKTITKQELRNINNNDKRTKEIIRTVIRDKYPDGSISTKTNEEILIYDKLFEETRKPQIQTGRFDFTEEPTEESTTHVETIIENGVSIKRKTVITKITQIAYMVSNCTKHTKVTILTNIEDEYPDGNVIRKTNEEITSTEELIDFTNLSEKLAEFLKNVPPIQEIHRKIPYQQTDIKYAGEKDQSKEGIRVVQPQINGKPEDPSNLHLHKKGHDSINETLKTKSFINLATDSEKMLHEERLRHDISMKKITDSVTTITSTDRDSTSDILGYSSSEDISKELSLEEKYSYESTEKTEKGRKERGEGINNLQKTLHKSSKLDQSSIDTEDQSLKLSTKLVDDQKSIKQDILGSESSQSDESITEPQKLISIIDSSIRKKSTDLVDSVHEAFRVTDIQQGIKTEPVEISSTKLDRVSTPPTVPVSPLPKTPSSFQDIKISDGVQSEVTYDKSDSTEETITKVVHIGDDILTQRISTSTEKVPKQIKATSEDECELDLANLMQTVGKIKTETDTVTKIIKEGENLVTQTVTTVTTKEIISREDGTPQNIKTTIETTTLSKSSDGSITTTKDTKTLLSECSSSLKSTSLMDLYSKDSKVDKFLIDSEHEKTESLLSDQKIETISYDTQKSSSETRELTKMVSDKDFASFLDSEDFEDNIEDTVIDTDVSKRIIKEDNVDIIETVTTITKTDTIGVDDTKKIKKTTTETNVTKEYPDGTKKVQKNVEVQSEEIGSDISTSLEKILNAFIVHGEPEESVFTKSEEIVTNNIIIQRTIVTKVIKTKYADCHGNIKKIKTVTIVTTTDRYPDNSSETKVDTSTTLTDVEEDNVIESTELIDYTIEENKTTNIDTIQKSVILEGQDVNQKITTTTTKQTLTTKDGSKKKLKTTIETVTESTYPSGTIEVTRQTQVLISDCEPETEDSAPEGFEIAGEPKEQVTEETEIINENGLNINRKTVITVLRQEFINISSNIKRIQTTTKTVVEDEYPDGSVITKTSEKISISDEALKTSEPDIKDVKYSESLSTTDESASECLIDDTILKSLTATEPPEETEAHESTIVQHDGIFIKRHVLTRTIKTKYSDSNGILKKVKIITIITTTDTYPDGSTRVSVDKRQTINDIESVDMVESEALQKYSKLIDRKVNTEVKQNIITKDGKHVPQEITVTTTKEILSTEDSKFSIVKTTIETITETKLSNGVIEVTKDVQVSVAQNEEDSFDADLAGYTEHGEPDENTTTDVEEVFEGGIKLRRKKTIVTTRQEYINSEKRSKKVKTTITTTIEDEHPDGTVIIKKSVKVAVADFLMKEKTLEDDTKSDEEGDTVEDCTEDSFVNNEIVQKEGIEIKRTVTTKTRREILASGDKNIERVRTTIETITDDEYPNGVIETTKDIKITISESQKTYDTDLKAALRDLIPTGKVKSSVDKKLNEIFTEHGKKVIQTITTYITKEEMINSGKNQTAVKTITETVTENKNEDGTVEVTNDISTQITYLPLGTSLDDWSPEELEKIEKQSFSPDSENISVDKEDKPIVNDLSLEKKTDFQADTKPKKRSPVGEITTETDTFTKVLHEGDNEITQTITVVTTKEVISPEKIKVTVETTTVSKGSDGITKTTRSTKTTISEIKEEFEEIIDTGESEKSFSKHSSKTGDMRSSSAASDDLDHPGISSPPSDISSRESRAATHIWGTESSGMYYSDEDGQVSPSSTKSQVAQSPRSNLSFEMDTKSHQPQESTFEMSVDRMEFDPMSTSIYGQLPEDDSCTYSAHSDDKTELHVTEKSIIKTTKEFLTQELKDSEKAKYSDASFLEEADEQFEKAIEEHKKVSGSEVMTSVTGKYKLDQKEIQKEDRSLMLKEIKTDAKKTATTSSAKRTETKVETSERKESGTSSRDPIESWGKPLGLPSPILPASQTDGKSTPKKQVPSSTVANKNKINQEKSREAKRLSESPTKKKSPTPIYMDLTYVPHHGNSYYSAIEFFKRVRARYYVFSGTEPSKEIYNALLDAKKTWEDKDLEVTIIPTYDTDVLGYWVTENEEALEKYKIDLSPSASRCTINLQDHETSCAAYRLEF
nr:microtubule-associated protein futsch isoform X2 [Danaus plexippus plexippus]